MYCFRQQCLFIVCALPMLLLGKSDSIKHQMAKMVIIYIIYNLIPFILFIEYL